MYPHILPPQTELTALEPELKKKSAETEELMQKLTVDQKQANEVWQINSTSSYTGSWASLLTVSCL